MKPRLPRTRPRDYMNPWALTGLGLLAVVYGGSYMFATVAGATHDLRLTRFGDILPVALYAAVWLAVGAVALIGMYSRRAFKVGFAGLTSLMLIWSLMNLGMYIFGGFTVVGSVVSAAIWGALSVCTHTLSVAEQTAIKVHDRGVEQATEAVDDLVVDLRTDGGKQHE